MENLLKKTFFCSIISIMTLIIRCFFKVPVCLLTLLSYLVVVVLSSFLFFPSRKLWDVQALYNSQIIVMMRLIYEFDVSLLLFCPSSFIRWVWSLRFEDWEEFKHTKTFWNTRLYLYITVLVSVYEVNLLPHVSWMKDLWCSGWFGFRGLCKSFDKWTAM